MTFWIRRLRFFKRPFFFFFTAVTCFSQQFSAVKKSQVCLETKEIFPERNELKSDASYWGLPQENSMWCLFFCGFPFFLGSCNRELHRTQTSLWPNWIQWPRSLCGLVVVPLVSWFFVALNAYRWLSTKCCWYSFCLSMFLSKVLKPVGPYCILKVKICWKSCKSQTNIQLCWDLVGSEVIWISVFKKLDVQWQVPVGKQVPNKFRH